MTGRVGTRVTHGRWALRSAVVLLVGLTAGTVPAGAAVGSTGSAPAPEDTATSSPAPSSTPITSTTVTPPPTTLTPSPTSVTSQPTATEVPGSEQPSPTTTTTPLTATSLPTGAVEPEVVTATPTTSTPAAPSGNAAVPDASRPLEPQYGTVSNAVLPPGQEQRATGHNFTPGSLVRVTLEPSGRDLGTYPAALDGTVDTRFSTAGLAPGAHTVRWTEV